LIEKTEVKVGTAKKFNNDVELLSMRQLQDIHNHFQGNFKMEGVPYCCAAAEDIIAVGFSDGSVSLYDQDETPLKHLSDKSIKNNSVVSMDINLTESHMFLITGHQKGNLALWELFEGRSLSGKLVKTVSNFKCPVVCCKFYGTSYEHDNDRTSAPCNRVVCSDLEGTVYLIWFVDGTVMGMKRTAAHS
jgi:WD40 repeat protein